MLLCLQIQKSIVESIVQKTIGGSPKTILGSCYQDVLWKTFNKCNTNQSNKKIKRYNVKQRKIYKKYGLLSSVRFRYFLDCEFRNTDFYMNKKKYCNKVAYNNHNESLPNQNRLFAKDGVVYTNKHYNLHNYIIWHAIITINIFYLYLQQQIIIHSYQYFIYNRYK